MKIKRVGWTGILWVFLFLIFLAGCLPEAEKAQEKPRGRNGFLDLSTWKLRQDGPIALDGEWEFYWGRLLEPEDFLGQNKIHISKLINLPRAWNGFIEEGRKLDGDGYATFRLRIENCCPDEALALKIPIMCTAYRMWANGELLAENGRVGRSHQEMVPQYRPQIASVESNQGGLELIVQVSNFMHRKGGFWESISIGTEKQIRGQRDQKLALQLLLLGGFLALGLHYIGLFVVRRKEPYAIYFALACLLMGLRVLLVGEIFLIQMFPDFSWAWELKLEYLTYYLAMLVLFLLLQALFPNEVSPFVRRITEVLSLGYSGLVLFTPARIYTHTLISYQLFTVFLVFYFIYVLVAAVRRHREGACFMLAGGIIYCATIIYDIFFYNFRTLAIGHLAPLGLFLFLLAQHLALMDRLAAAFFRTEDLSLRLLAADKLKDEFLAGVSLKLKIPLGGILGIAESILGGASDPLTDDQKRNVSLIAAGSKYLSVLVEDILDFCRLKNRDITLDLVAVNLHSLVEMVREVCRPLMLDKDLELKNQVPENFPPVHADKNRLHQIFYNLVGNAIKYTPSGSITVSACQQESFIKIMVAATGTNISDDHWANIFHPVQQAGDDISRHYSSADLGLSVSKNLVELHGGYMGVKSEPGQGFYFHFTLPISTDPAAAVKPKKQTLFAPGGPSIRLPHAETAQVLENDLSQPLILVANDDPIDLQVLVNQLSLKGYRIITATGGHQALSIVEQASDRLDLVILAVMMPEMSGYEVSRRLRQKYTLFELPILLVTAKSRIDDVTAGLEAGANDYIARPFDKNELSARVHTLLILKQSVAHAMINQQLATVDDLTGLHNRRFFFQVAEQEVSRAKIYGFPLSLIMFDVDHFKTINDSYGHSAGDDVLRAIAERCQGLLRDDDVLARFGGDEFVVLLIKDNLAAKQVAERIRQKIVLQPIILKKGQEIHVSASFGIATVTKDVTDLAGLLENTDRALYQAKQQGRNRVMAFGSVPKSD